MTAPDAAPDGMSPFGRMSPLPEGANFFDYIREEEKFKQFVHDEYKDEAGIFEVNLYDAELSNAHCCYLSDIAHAEEEMKPSPSHFTQAGFLAYRLSYCRLNANWGADDNSEIFVPRGKKEAREKARNFLVNYGHLYLAFGLGYRICLYFEREIERKMKGKQVSKRALPDPNKNYLEAVCHLMKNERISPYAMGFIYHSLFL